LLHYHFFRVLHTEQRDSVSCISTMTQQENE